MDIVEKLRASKATDIYDQGKLDLVLEEAAQIIEALRADLLAMNTRWLRTRNTRKCTGM